MGGTTNDRCRSTAFRLFGATVHVDGHGTDHLAIRAAVQAAGEGGTLLFTSGSTYTLGGQVGQLPGQTWASTGSAENDVHDTLASAGKLSQPRGQADK